MVLRVHGALVGHAGARRARLLARHARLLPRVPRRLLHAGRVPRPAARALVAPTCVNGIASECNTDYFDKLKVFF